MMGVIFLNKGCINVNHLILLWDGSYYNPGYPNADGLVKSIQSVFQFDFIMNRDAEITNGWEFRFFCASTIGCANVDTD